MAHEFESGFVVREGVVCSACALCRGAGPDRPRRSVFVAPHGAARNVLAEALS